MNVDTGTIVPRSEVSIAVEAGLRGSLADRSRGGVLVIDYFASRRCSVVIGDLTAEFRKAPPGTGFAELVGVDGVRVFAETRLLKVLAGAGTTLRLGGPPFARHIALDLDEPERWIDFLERPGVLAGKRRSLGRR